MLAVHARDVRADVAAHLARRDAAHHGADDAEREREPHDADLRCGDAETSDAVVVEDSEESRDEDCAARERLPPRQQGALVVGRHGVESAEEEHGDHDPAEPDQCGAVFLRTSADARHEADELPRPDVLAQPVDIDQVGE